MLALIWMSTSMASPYKALINLGKTFLRISRIRIILLTQILARVFVYLPPLISQILDFICRMVLIFILIYFEWRDTENLQYICVRCKNMLRTITIPGSNSGSQRKKNPGLNRVNRERLFFFFYLQEIHNELGQGWLKPMPSLQPIVLVNIRIQPFCTEQTNNPFTPTKYVVFN